MFVLSCEPATCAVPEWHRELFKGREETLAGEGWEPGSLNLAQAFATKLRTLLAYGDVTRLLVDFSRRPDDPERFSRFSKTLNEEQRRKLDERHHLAFIHQLRQRITEEMHRGDPALHLSLRTADRPDMAAVELVHDPSRDIESTFIRKWADALRAAAPELPVLTVADPNYPLSSFLRQEFPSNFGSISVVAARSSFLEGRPMRWEKLKKLMIETMPRS